MHKWPAVWITVGAWIVLNAMFGDRFNYISYTTRNSSFSNDGTSTASLLPDLLPGGVLDVLPLPVLAIVVMSQRNLA
jgi:hypothetical protein